MRTKLLSYEDRKARNEEIRRLAAAGKTNRELSEIFDLTPTYISWIKHAEDRPPGWATKANGEWDVPRPNIGRPRKNV